MTKKVLIGNSELYMLFGKLQTEAMNVVLVDKHVYIDGKLLFFLFSVLF